ncbi:MAG: hypothetical protein V3U02_10765 [Calditrichia bacterium]
MPEKSMDPDDLPFEKRIIFEATIKETGELWDHIMDNLSRITLTQPHGVTLSVIGNLSLRLSEMETELIEGMAKMGMTYTLHYFKWIET